MGYTYCERKALVFSSDADVERKGEENQEGRSKHFYIQVYGGYESGDSCRRCSDGWDGGNAPGSRGWSRVNASASSNYSGDNQLR
jgi:hypothetical protein